MCYIYSMECDSAVKKQNCKNPREMYWTRKKYSERHNPESEWQLHFVFTYTCTLVVKSMLAIL